MGKSKKTIRLIWLFFFFFFLYLLTEADELETVMAYLLRAHYPVGPERPLFDAEHLRAASPPPDRLLMRDLVDALEDDGLYEEENPLPGMEDIYQGEVGEPNAVEGPLDFACEWGETG